MKMVSKGRYILFIEIIFVFLGYSLVRSVITDVRLVGGPTSNKGTVEIRIDNGTWETTCGVNLGNFDVIVICRQLGFAGVSRRISVTPYGHHLTPARGLGCNGDEANLTGCKWFLTSSCSTAGAVSCHGAGYLGCFVDLSTDRVFLGDNVVGAPDMTISNCIQFCNESSRADYTYAGVENRTECYCGEASDDYSRHGVGLDADCPVPCSGDPTESCGGTGYIAVFGMPTTLQSPETTIYHQDTDCSKEVTSTITVGVLLACVALFGIIIALMYLNLRRSYIALKQSVSEREGKELDPYTSLDATIMNQPTYEDIKATRHGDRGHETTMNQPAYDDTIATIHGDRGHAATLNQPAYDDTIATTHGDGGHTNEIEGVEYENQTIETVDYENQTIVKQTARFQESNLGVADENTEPEYELPIEK